MSAPLILKACPLRKVGKLQGLSVVWESDTARIKHWGSIFVPCAVFMIAYQRKTAAGELDTDLMTSAGVQTDADKGRVRVSQPGKLQPGSFYAGPLPFYNEYLVLPAIFKQQIFPVALFRHTAVD